MKKYIALLLAFVLLVSACGCGKGKNKDNEGSSGSVVENVGKKNDGVFRVGFVFPAEADAPDSKARLECVRKMQKELGLSDDQVLMACHITKDKGYDEIKALAENGCDVIFGLSVRYQEAMLELAQEYDKIQFCIEGGRESIESPLDNVHTFNSKIYEAYYACGVAAGMKVNEMLNDGKASSDDCRIGFVAYKEAPETTTCINAFYLGVKKVCSQTRIAVRYVDKRGNYDADGKEARQLAASGACMMCQYTFTTAVAAVCAENEIPVFGTEQNIINIAPDMAMTSTYTDWSVYYIDAVKTAMDNKEIPKDWVGGYKKGVVRLTQLNDANIADGTVDRLIELEKDLRKGKADIFDTNNMYKDGESFASLINSSDDFKKYKNYVKNGIFNEQSKMSAPVLDHLMDGIYISTDNFISSESTEEGSEQ